MLRVIGLIEYPGVEGQIHDFDLITGAVGSLRWAASRRPVSSCGKIKIFPQVAHCRASVPLWGLARVGDCFETHRQVQQTRQRLL